MEPLTPTVLAGLLAEPKRLRALAAVALGATTAPEVADLARLSGKDAATALHRLRTAGVVVEQDGRLSIAVDALRAAAATERPEPDPTGLRPFVEGRRLLSLPAAADRRWSVLAHVATHALENGRDYDEREVTERLQEWCEGGTVDAVALRRYLVEQGLVSRGGGTYRLGSDGPEPSPGERMVRGLGLS